MIFKQLAIAAIVFQNEAKIVHRQVFIAINIPCRFGEYIFINEWPRPRAGDKKSLSILLCIS